MVLRRDTSLRTGKKESLHALRRNRVVNRIEIARDGAEALDFLFCRGTYSDQEFSGPKLILLDSKLPKVDGLEVLRAIRPDERTKLLPVVILTSPNERRDVVESYESHVNSCIQKPVDFEQFHPVVQQLGLYLARREPDSAGRTFVC